MSQIGSSGKMSQTEAPHGYSQQPGAPPPYEDVAYPPPPGFLGQPPLKGYSQPGAHAQPTVYYGPPQGQPTAQSTVVVTTLSSAGIIFRDVPVSMQCPNCHNHITSTCVYESGALVWIIALVIAIVFQLWLGCCLIPFCIDALKDVRHVCPVCSYQLGVYKRL